MIALDEADMLLLLVDGRSPVTSSEQVLSEIIKKSGKPFLLVANKIDDISHENDALSYYELGMGNPIAVSAQAGRKSGDLLDEIVMLLPKNLSYTSYGCDFLRSQGTPEPRIIGPENPHSSASFFETTPIPVFFFDI